MVELGVVGDRVLLGLELLVEGFPGIQALSHPSVGSLVPTWRTLIQGLLQNHYG